MTTSSEPAAGGRPRRVKSRSTADTERAAAALGELLSGGECVLLEGELGSGKTTFVRGLARGLGVDDPAAVHSPSYTLVNRYSGRLPLLHVDAYFMRSGEDLDLCGFEDALARREVVAVEWADRIAPVLHAAAARPTRWIRVVLQHGGGDNRNLQFENQPAARRR